MRACVAAAAGDLALCGSLLDVRLGWLYPALQLRRVRADHDDDGHRLDCVGMGDHGQIAPTAVSVPAAAFAYSAHSAFHLLCACRR